eukprot:6454923-Amphidinium_carterae.2
MTDPQTSRGSWRHSWTMACCFCRCTSAATAGVSAASATAGIAAGGATSSSRACSSASSGGVPAPLVKSDLLDSVDADADLLRERERVGDPSWEILLGCRRGGLLRPGRMSAAKMRLLPAP